MVSERQDWVGALFVEDEAIVVVATPLEEAWQAYRADGVRVHRVAKPAALHGPRLISTWFNGAISKLRDLTEGHEVLRLAFGGFGPFGSIEPTQPDFGWVQPTSSHADWRGIDVVSFLNRAFDQAAFKAPAETIIQSDVSMVALGEALMSDDIFPSRVLAAVHAGDGIGTAIVHRGSIVNGALHGEGGQVYVVRHSEDNFGSICEYHAQCAEGLASGQAIARRGPDIDWPIIAFYYAQICHSLVCFVAPHRIVLSGPVFDAKAPDDLVALVRAELRALLSWSGPLSYPNYPALEADDFLARPRSTQAGWRGAIYCAARPTGHVQLITLPRKQKTEV